MRRPARLQAARAWLAAFSGKHVVKSYARWFGVDLGCALTELQLLGVELDTDYVTALRRTLRQRARGRREVRPNDADTTDDSDEHFAYIAGYTEADFAFGVTWEEWERCEEREEHNSVELFD